MMPNIDPRTMRNMMAKMGIKSTEIPASKVVIDAGEKTIVISNPQVTRIEAQGTTSFQISGDISEQQAHVQVEISQDDIDVAAASSGVSDPEKVMAALKAEDGDIARAILRLKKETTSP
jgi:nascent polypeptide-associated complex subunit alpha